MESYTSIFLKIKDENTITFAFNKDVSKKDYINSIVKFVLAKPDLTKLTGKNIIPKEALTKLKQQLLVCKLHTVSLILTHIDDANWESKEALHNYFVEQVLLKNKNSNFENLKDYLALYWDGFVINLPYAYVQMRKRFGFYLVYDGPINFIEYPSEDDISTLKPFSNKYWANDVDDEILEIVKTILDREIIKIEEFMAFPINVDNYYTSDDYLPCRHISNYLKWYNIALELSNAMKKCFDRITTTHSELYFETDWETQDNIDKGTRAALKEADNIAKKYNIILSQAKKNMGSVVALSFYDASGQLYISFDIWRDDKNLFIRLFDKKNVKFKFNIFVCVAENKHAFQLFENPKFYSLIIDKK